MKKSIFLAFLTFLFLSSLSAQVESQANVAWIITNPNPDADPYLCAFGNSPNDVTLLNSVLNLRGRNLVALNEREEANLPQSITREMERLNARFLAVYIIQRELDYERALRGENIVYFIVDAYERVGNRYYRVATNR